MDFLSQRTLREKLMSYLSDAAEKNGKVNFTIPYSRQELADYLHVDRSALSRELSKMRRDGVIDFNKNVFKLNKPQGNYFL